MESDNKIKLAKYGYIVISILMGILGICVILIKDFSVPMLTSAGGILLLIFGLVKIIGYLSKDLYRLAFQHDLAFGILLIAIGIILLVRTESMMHIICTLFGIFVLADGMMKIQISIEAKAFGIKLWWLILSTALVTAIIGFILALRPYSNIRIAMVIVGITLISEGILNIVTILTAVKIIKIKPTNKRQEID